MSPIVALFRCVLDRARAGRSYLSAITGNVGLSLIGAVTGVMLARSLTVAERGAFVAVLVWPTSLALLAGCGVNTAVSYYVAKTPGRSGRTIETAVALGLLSGGVLATCGVLVSGVLNADVAADTRLVFSIGPVYLAGGSLVGALLTLDLRRWNLARFVSPLVYLAGLSLVAMTFGLTVHRAAWAFCASVVAQFAVAAILVQRSGSPFLPSLRKGESPRLLSYGLKSLFGHVPQLVNARADQLVLSLLVPKADLGLYAVAVTASTLAAPVAQAIGTVGFARSAGSTAALARRHVERTVVRYSAAAIASTAAGSLVLCPQILTVLFGAEYGAAVTYTRWLILGSCFAVMNGVLGDLLRGRGRPAAVGTAELIAAVATGLLIVLFVPSYGVAGAVAASLAAYALSTAMLTMQLLRARRTDES